MDAAKEKGVLWSDNKSKAVVCAVTLHFLPQLPLPSSNHFMCHAGSFVNNEIN